MRVDPQDGSISNPQSLNRYAYAQNDVVNLHDPLGLDPILILPPDNDYPEGTCIYFGSWEHCFRSTGENTNNDTGKGRRGNQAKKKKKIEKPKDLDAKQKKDRFLEENPDCETAIDLASIAAGGLGRISEIDATFINATDEDLLNTTLAELKFPPGFTTGSAPLFIWIGKDGLGLAITNWDTNEIYLGPDYYADTPKEQSITVIHELLHGLFNGNHVLIAEKLGLSDNGKPYKNDTDASRAISEFLRQGCH
jgi:hypothetical protein